MNRPHHVSAIPLVERSIGAAGFEPAYKPRHFCGPGSFPQALPWRGGLMEKLGGFR